MKNDKAEAPGSTDIPLGSMDAAGSLAASLANAIAAFTAVGCLDEARELKKELLQVSKSVTWLMREDRRVIKARS